MLLLTKLQDSVNRRVDYDPTGEWLIGVQADFVVIPKSARELIVIMLTRSCIDITVLPFEGLFRTGKAPVSDECRQYSVFTRLPHLETFEHLPNYTLDSTRF